MSMPENYSKFILIINDSEKSLLQISDEESSVKKSPTKWSKKEILGHLIDSAGINQNRFLIAVFKDNLIFETYNQDEWVKLHQYNNQNWGNLIQLWKLLNLQIAEVVQNIQVEKKLANTVIHNFDKICFIIVESNQESNLDYLINDYITHMEHHLKQIFEYDKGK